MITLKNMALGLSSVAIVGCAGPRPFLDHTLAQAALSSARDYGAATFSPGYWHKAQDHYRMAEKNLESNENKLAKKNFKKARVFAEKSENLTRLRKFKSGEGFP